MIQSWTIGRVVLFLSSFFSVIHFIKTQHKNALSASYVTVEALHSMLPAKLQNTPQLISASLTCVGRLWRSRHNTIDAILIQWHVNELRGILKLLHVTSSVMYFWSLSYNRPLMSYTYDSTAFFANPFSFSSRSCSTIWHWKKGNKHVRKWWETPIFLCNSQRTE